jgi:hypothetical protein
MDADTCVNPATDPETTHTDLVATETSNNTETATTVTTINTTEISADEALESKTTDTAEVVGTSPTVAGAQQPAMGTMDRDATSAPQEPGDNAASEKSGITTTKDGGKTSVAINDTSSITRSELSTLCDQFDSKIGLDERVPEDGHAETETAEEASTTITKPTSPPPPEEYGAEGSAEASSRTSGERDDDTADNAIAPSDNTEHSTTSQTGTAAAGPQTFSHPPANGYDYFHPNVSDAIGVFRDLYHTILGPAFDHPAWTQLSGGWDLALPTRTRTLLDMFDAFEAGAADVDALRSMFAHYVIVFCSVEMKALQSRPEDWPGRWFRSDKYGYWCGLVWRDEWRLPFWVATVYAYRNEWAWGVDGGTRGVAGFTEAVGLFAQVFCRMLENGWPGNVILYHRACWEMKEYLMKWAVRMQPLAAAGQQTEGEQPGDDQLEPHYPQYEPYQAENFGFEYAPDYFAEYPPLGEYDPAGPPAADGEEEEDDDDDDNASVHSDDSDVTIRAYSGPVDGTDLLLDELQYDDDAQGNPPPLPEDNEHAQYGDAFPPYTGGHPEGTEGFPTFVEPPRSDAHIEPFPEYTEPAATSGPSQGGSLASSAAGPSAPAPRRRARANTNAAELLEDEDADLRWFGEYVLDRQL